MCKQQQSQFITATPVSEAHIAALTLMMKLLVARPSKDASKASAQVLNSDTYTSNYCHFPVGRDIHVIN